MVPPLQQGDGVCSPLGPGVRGDGWVAAGAGMCEDWGSSAEEQ